jgi:plastocyanin
MPMTFLLPKRFAEVNSNPITAPESENDMTPVTEKTMNVTVTPASVAVEPGVTLQFTNDAKEFPKFEIEFDGPSPSSSGEKIFKGTTKIEIHVTEEGEFHYSIKHCTALGHCFRTGDFSVRSCPGGCPQLK